MLSAAAALLALMAAAARPPVIDGYVQDESGNFLSNIEVRAWVYSAATKSLVGCDYVTQQATGCSPATYAFTDSSGHYAIPLAANTYYLDARPGPGQTV